MSWWPFTAASGPGDGSTKVLPKGRMTLTDARNAGYYIAPPEMAGVKIWGWDLRLDGGYVAGMTASDRDFAETRKLAERLVFAYNLEFGDDK